MAMFMRVLFENVFLSYCRIVLSLSSVWFERLDESSYNYTRFLFSRFFSSSRAKATYLRYELKAKYDSETVNAIVMTNSEIKWLKMAYITKILLLPPTPIQSSAVT